MWLLWVPTASVWVGDFWTISLFDFVILFCSFLYILSVCFSVGIIIGIPSAPFYFLTLYGREMSGLSGFCGPVGVV